MMDGRMPRPAGDNIRLAGVLYQLNGAVVRGDMIVYTASVLDQEVWENILIRELYPCNNGIRRLENKEISIASDGCDMFLAAKRTAHQAPVLWKRMVLFTRCAPSKRQSLWMPCCARAPYHWRLH